MADLSPDFRLDYVEGLVGYLGEQYPTMTVSERAHSIGILAHTMTTLAANNHMSTTTPPAALEVLDLLSDDSLETVRAMVVDEDAAQMLWDRSAKMTQVLRAAFELNTI